MKVLSAEELCDIGYRNLKDEQWEEANEIFQQALLIDPALKRALLGRAVVLRTGLYDYEQAQRLLNRCLYHHADDADALTEQGRLHAAEGNYARAVDFFERALAREPNKQEAVEGKIQSLLAEGRSAESQLLINTIAPRASRPTWLVRLLAHVYIVERAYDEAVEAFLTAAASEALYEALASRTEKAAKDALAAAIVARLGNDPQALAAVERAHSVWGDLEAAVETCRRLLQVAPEDEQAHCRLIELLREQGRVPEADGAYRSAVSSMGHTSDPLLVAHARVLYDSGRRDQGIEALTKISDQQQLFSFLDEAEISDKDITVTLQALVERYPSNTALLSKAASRLASAGDASQALALLKRVLELDPKDIDAVAAKGEILLEQDRLDDLDSFLKRAHATFGTDPKLVSLESRLLIARSRFVEAVRAAVSAGMENAIEEHFYALYDGGDTAKAEKLVSAAVAEEPNSISFLRARAWLFLQQRSYEAAAKASHAVWERQPDNTDALLQEVSALRLARQFDEAALILDKAMRRASPSTRGRLLTEYGYLYYDQGRYEDAAHTFNLALNADPGNSGMHLWRIRVLRISGRRADAESAIEHAMATTPFYDDTRAEIICERGKLHEAREDWKAAAASYAEARTIAPALTDPYFLEASALLRLNRNSEAEHLVESILKQRGTENQVKEQAGWFYLSKKDFITAEAQFKEILRRAPSDFAAINGLGGVYFEQGKYGLAEAMFRGALKIDQTISVLWNNLAWALVRQIGVKDARRDALLAEAEAQCRKSIELLPTNANAHACLGIIAFKRRRLMECEHLLKRATDLDPTRNYSDLGALYAYLGRYDEARKILEKGREVDRYDVSARIELGNVYVQLGMTKEAIVVLKEACAIDPQADEPAVALSVALTKAGDLMEATRVLRNAIGRHEHSSAPSLHVALGRVLTDLADKTEDPNDYAAALKEIRIAIAAQPQNAEAYFHAGVACFGQEDYRGAFKHFKRCHELDPSNFEAEQNLRKLKSISRQELGRARIGIWIGTTVGIICFLLLMMLWGLYLQQPVPASKEVIRQIDPAMLLTLSPILLALVFVAILMPWLSRLKLPGGVEAELAPQRERLSTGPSGPPVTLGPPIISSGPK